MRLSKLVTVFQKRVPSGVRPRRRGASAAETSSAMLAVMPVEVCDADGEAGDSAEARGVVRESGAEAAVEDEASVELVCDDAECEERARLRVVAREAAQLALHAEATCDVARSGERGLSTRSVAVVGRATCEKIDGVEVEGRPADVFADERDDVVIHTSGAETFGGARRRELNVVGERDAGARF